jgi:flagellar basal-body rod protein FlgB
MIDTPEVALLSRFLDLAVVRGGVIAANMANVDTPGYRTRDINFRQELDRVSDQPGNDGSNFIPLSPVARQVQGLNARPDGNNVSLEREGLLLSETQMRFSIAVQLLKGEFHGLMSAIHEGSTS